MSKNRVEKYLAKYAEPEAALAESWFKAKCKSADATRVLGTNPSEYQLLKQWSRVVAVPLCAEGVNVLELLKSIDRAALAVRCEIKDEDVYSRHGYEHEFLVSTDCPDSAAAAAAAVEDSDVLPAARVSVGVECSQNPMRVLVILVINNRASASSNIKRDNAETWDLLCSVSKQVEVFESDWQRMMHGMLGHCEIVVIDRFSDSRGLDQEQMDIERGNGRQMPEKQGVGLARKIASDFAVVACHRGCVRLPVIFNTDGDACVAADYFDLDEFEIPENSMDTFLTPFVHEVDSNRPCSEQLAIRLYDHYLHYYVEGLSFAGSPYAYQTVGSTIAYHMNSYVAVRGFPRREAGEDFYLLNKLAKVGVIRKRSVGSIRLLGRVSYRVPFGTGASVGKISSLLDQGQTYKIYDWKCFVVLKIWLEVAQRGLLSEVCDEEDFTEWLGDELKSELRKELGGVEDETSETIVEYLKCSGAFRAMASLMRGSKKPEIRQKNFDHWFDSFRTLKFIHEVRDSTFPSQTLSLEHLERSHLD